MSESRKLQKTGGSTLIVSLPKKWITENRKITNDVTKIEISDYKSFEKKELVKNKDLINQNIKKIYGIVPFLVKELLAGY